MSGRGGRTRVGELDTDRVRDSSNNRVFGAALAQFVVVHAFEALAGCMGSAFDGLSSVVPARDGGERSGTLVVDEEGALSRFGRVEVRLSFRVFSRFVISLQTRQGACSEIVTEGRSPAEIERVGTCDSVFGLDERGLRMPRFVVPELDASKGEYGLYAEPRIGDGVGDTQPLVERAIGGSIPLILEITASQCEEALGDESLHLRLTRSIEPLADGRDRPSAASRREPRPSEPDVTPGAPPSIVEVSSLVQGPFKMVEGSPEVAESHASSSEMASKPPFEVTGFGTRRLVQPSLQTGHGSFTSPRPHKGPSLEGDVTSGRHPRHLSRGTLGEYVVAELFSPTVIPLVQRDECAGMCMESGTVEADGGSGGRIGGR